MALGGEFLNYNVLAHDPVHGQHYGIIAIELGVLITVFGAMVGIFYAFAGRRRLDP
jgi:multicomponent Na+:H+ antiporter subunit B